MLINDDYLFIHVQRSGGSFIEKFLIENFDGCSLITPKHGGWYEIKSSSELKEGRLSFGVVRNPWGFYVSWWSANRKVGPKKTMFPQIFNERTLSDFNEFIPWVMTLNHGRTSYFNFDTMSKLDIGPYTYRQLECHYTSFDELWVDALVHRENLEEELADIMQLDNKRREVLFNMPRYHVGDHKPYEEYYNDESRILVEYKDRFVIQEHGYTFDRS